MRANNFEAVTVVCNSRAEAGPLQSVFEAMPGCRRADLNVEGLEPHLAVGYALRHFTDEFTLYKPKIVVVLGDRYETHAAAYAAMFLNIPVAHIHGGETTLGAFDDAIRDSITSIATLHFAAAVPFQERILKIRGVSGRPYRVYTAGAPGLDGIRKDSAKRTDKKILVTYHPETNEDDRGLRGAVAMLKALDAFPDYDVHFTGVNADPGTARIKGLIDEWCWNTRRGVLEPLPHGRYIAAMQSAALVLGNSSAGIIEAPWIGIPTVNIGGRQDGRPFCRSIFTCRTPSADSIAAAISEALAWKGPNYYHHYQGGAAPKIARIIGEFCGIQTEQSDEARV